MHVFYPRGWEIWVSRRTIHPSVRDVLDYLTNCPGLVGAPLAGRLSDRIVVYYRKKRGGEWYPEDRLRATLLGALIVPLSVLASGLLTEYVPGTLGLTLNLVCLFMNGFGVIF